MFQEYQPIWGVVGRTSHFKDKLVSATSKTSAAMPKEHSINKIVNIIIYTF